MPIELRTCQDCGLDLPLKQFAQYTGKRHTLCRTCLAIDVAEFKSWVLPYVQERRAAGEAPFYWEDWEIAVLHRLELTGLKRAAMTLRGIREMSRRPEREKRGSKRYTDPVIIRPWKYALVDA